MKNTSIEIIEILKNAGHQAYWAGGCVRDMLLGIKPKDFDIVTSANPDEIEHLLERTIPIGKEFGVILAIQGGHHFEIATFRSDSGYSDGRRPDAVTFTNAKEDAFRRDFTINGIFYDPTTDKILDYVGGQKDMKDGLVRFIGDPEERIKEDHLRILRAIRFKNVYGMQYHPKTYQAIKKHANLVTNVSSERIRDELMKIIESERAGQAFEDLFETGVLELIIPELCNLKGLAQPLMYHKEGDVWDHSLKALAAVDRATASQALLWGTFLHDIGKYETFSIDNERIRYDHHAEVGAEIAKKILDRLNFPKKIVQRVHWLISHHMMVTPLFDMSEGRRKHWFLQEGFEDLLALFKADVMGTDPCDLSVYEKLKKMYRHEIATLKLMPKQLIGGEEVMKTLNIPAGERVGKILEEIRHKQLEGEITTPEEAKKYLQKLN